MRVGALIGVRLCVLVLLGSAAVPATAAAAAGWAPTGSMNEARVRATAAPLPNGRVLVAGGFNQASGYLAGAEVFDGIGWRATDAMSAARGGATATPLANGRVLVAGGRDTSGYLASAEVFDAGTGTWTPTGAMTAARAEATATRLADGRVLVAGGNNDADGFLAGAEIYDPATGTWAPTGAMTAARATATATRLPGGSVLVAGGYNEASGFLAGAEIYNPGSGTWTPTGTMTAARVRATATALPDGSVLIAGGYNGSGYLGAAELFDPSAGSWSDAGTATAAEEAIAAPLPGGGVLVAGGFNGGAYLSRSETYAPDTRTWTRTGTMTTARGEAIATPLPDGRVLVAGGFNNFTGHLASAETFTPATSASVPGSVDFGPVAVAESSAPRTVSVANTGTAPLLVTSVTRGGADAADFEIVSDSCSTAPTAVGGICAIVVRFTPRAKGDRSATLTLADNAGTGSQQVALEGVGLAPAVSVPPGLDFGSLTVGEQSPLLSVPVANIGEAPLQVTDIGIAGTDAADFEIPADADGCSAGPTAPGSECRIELRFTPGGEGHRTATLTITDNAGTGSQQVALEGTGVPPVVPPDPPGPTPPVPPAEVPTPPGPAGPNGDAAPHDPGGAGGQDRPADPARGRIRVRIASRTARRGWVRLRLRCTGTKRCRGRLTLTTRRGRARTVLAGGRRYAMRPGSHARRVRLDGRARRALKRRGRLRVTATATLRQSRRTAHDTRTLIGAHASMALAAAPRGCDARRDVLLQRRQARLVHGDFVVPRLGMSRLRLSWRCRA
jgi:hypothetical protein